MVKGEDQEGTAPGIFPEFPGIRNMGWDFQGDSSPPPPPPLHQSLPFPPGLLFPLTPQPQNTALRIPFPVGVKQRCVHLMSGYPRISVSRWP